MTRPGPKKNMPASAMDNPFAQQRRGLASIAVRFAGR